MAKQKFWYSTEIEYCPVCGSMTRYKQREYTKRPVEWRNRNTVTEVYDYCDEHGHAR